MLADSCSGDGFLPAKFPTLRRGTLQTGSFHIPLGLGFFLFRRMRHRVKNMSRFFLHARQVMSTLQRFQTPFVVFFCYTGFL